MKLSRMAAIPLRQFYLYRGSAARLVPLFAWVTIDMVLWGFMTKFLSGMAQTSYRFVPALLGAVLFWDFMTRVMQGVTTAFFEDVWTRNFLNVFASPITMPEYIGGLLVSSVATSLVGLVVMIVVATLAFGLRFGAYGVMLAPFVLVLFLFGMALGVAAIAIVLRLGRDPSALRATAACSPGLRSIRHRGYLHLAIAGGANSLLAFFRAPLDSKPCKIAQLNNPGHHVRRNPKLVIDNVWIHLLLRP